MSKWLTKPKAFIMYTAKRKPLMFMIFVLSDTSEINQLTSFTSLLSLTSLNKVFDQVKLMKMKAF